jgi:hypothetical protein
MMHSALRDWAYIDTFFNFTSKGAARAYLLSLVAVPNAPRRFEEIPLDQLAHRLASAGSRQPTSMSIPNF